MLKNIKDFICMHLNFKVYNVTVAAIIAALAIAPCVMFLPESYGFENGVLENLQLIVLFLGFIFALMAKDNKKFFYFVAMIIAVLAKREVNCFRTVFFAIPGEINEFYTWDQIKFGWLYHPIYGLFIAYVAFYFLKNKLFLTAWEMLKNIKLPVWNILLMLSGMLLGVIAESVFANTLFEESAELLFYLSLTGIIYLYVFDKDYNL